MNAREMIEALSKLDPDTPITFAEYSVDDDHTFVWEVGLFEGEIELEKIARSWKGAVEDDE